MRSRVLNFAAIRPTGLRANVSVCSRSVSSLANARFLLRGLTKFSSTFSFCFLDVASIEANLASFDSCTSIAVSDYVGPAVNFR